MWNMSRKRYSFRKISLQRMNAMQTGEMMVQSHYQSNPTDGVTLIISGKPLYCQENCRRIIKPISSELLALIEEIKVYCILSFSRLPSTGVTSDTRGNFGHYIKFSLFCLFLIILWKYFSPVEFLANYRLYFFRKIHYIGRKTKLWRDMNVSKWRHTLKNWRNLSWSK